MTPIIADLIDALGDARKFILFDRDCLYQSVSLHDGSIPDDNDRKDLQDVDDLLDRIDVALRAAAE